MGVNNDLRIATVLSWGVLKVVPGCELRAPAV